MVLTINIRLAFLAFTTNIKVSPIRAVPAIIEGKIVGKGIPGYYFGEDLYFQDNTGLMYIDYRFGFSLVDFFGLFQKLIS